MNTAIRVRGGTAKIKAVTTTLLAAVMLVGSCTCSAPRNAYAVDNTDSTGNTNLSAGALCAPTSQSMGTDVDAEKDRDPGVATWVGGDMYVGKKSDNLNNANGPDGSYAVEAEGLTVVNGDLLLHPLKDSWKKNGFRFGVAGFGTQFRPANGSTALAVGGNSSTLSSSTQAWGKPAFVRDYDHQALLAGGSTNIWDTTDSPSVKAWNTTPNPVGGNATVSWNLADLTNIPVATADGGSTTNTDLSKSAFFNGYVVNDIAAPLAGQAPTGTVSVSEADTTLVMRHKYNYANETEAAKKIQYQFKYSDEIKSGTNKGIDSATSYKNREKLITFTGTNNPSLEVFNLSASDLNDMIDGQRYRGVAFSFQNIADTASVVINVDGQSSDISFHTGWKFYWGSQEIGDGYSSEASAEQQQLYAKAAQKILWNFRNTNNLTIYGGVANEGTSDNKTTEDDPAAAMLGSIVVIGNSTEEGSEAKSGVGNFESHVSTNGRVYTEGDFSMHNPYVAAYFGKGIGEGNSASVLDMDQERHNFPWSGSYTESCSAIAWQKSDENGTALGGTTWAVYGTYAGAKAGTSALLTVKDGSYYDKDSTAGSFTVEGLKNNATYYIKEVATGSDSYQLNTNIYYAATGEASDTPVKVAHSVADDGITLGTTDMTSNGAIINKPSGHEVSWSKTADDTQEVLAGSAWQIKLKDDQTNTKIWNVEDNTSEATGVTAEAQSSTLNASNDWKTTLNATVEPSDALQQVNWTFTSAEGTTSEPSSDAAVLAKTGDTTATITGISATDATVYVKACSVSNPDVCSNAITIAVEAANVTAFEIKDADGKTVHQGDAITTAAEGDELAFTASVTPSIPITWASSNNAVAMVTTSANGQNATVRMVGFGSATITATAGNQTLTFTVKVPSTTVYFKKSLPNPGWSQYYLYYSDGTSSTWKFVKMTESCGDYVYVTIPKAAQGNGFVFRNRAETTGSDNWYKPSDKDDSHFTFTGNSVQVVELYNNSTGSTVPAGCAATVATMSAESTESAAIESVEFADAIANDSATAETTSAATTEATVDGTFKASSCTATDGTAADHPGVKCDTNTAPGQFTVGELDAGTYLLHEITAPDGYTLNTTVYQFTIGADGKVEWNGGWADGDTPGSINPELKPDAANSNAISDSPTDVTWYKVSSENISGGYLTGAQWELKRTADGSGAVVSNETYCVVDGNGDGGKNSSGELICPRSDVAHASAIRLTDVSNTDTETGTVQNTADGIITLKGLKFGTYTLTETVAPDGYDLSTVAYTFTIDQNSSGDAVRIVSGDDEIAGNKIPNKPGVELPATGGVGTEAFRLWGTLAVLVAVAGLTLQVRRSRR